MFNCGYDSISVFIDKDIRVVTKTSFDSEGIYAVLDVGIECKYISDHDVTVINFSTEVHPVVE